MTCRLVDLQGHVVEGRWRPSSDTATHLALYRRYPDLGGVVHTHSTHATARAQAGWRSRRSAPPMRTTSSAIFPAPGRLAHREVDEAYELNTGQVIIETLGEANPLHTPGIVVPISTGHLPGQRRPRGGTQRGGDGRGGAHGVDCPRH